MHRKPFHGIQLNRHHPLVRNMALCCLFNEKQGGTFFDLAQYKIGTTNTPWGNEGARFTGASDEAYVPFELRSQDIGTVLFGYKTTGTPSAYSAFIYHDAGATAFNIWRENSNTRYSFRLGALVYPINVSTSIYDGNPHSFALTFNANTDVVQAFVNGIYEGQQTGDSFSAGTFSGNLYIGSDSSANNQIGGDMEYLYILWDILSDEEIAAIHADPYQIFEFPSKAGLFHTAAAGGSTMAGIYYRMLLQGGLR